MLYDDIDIISISTIEDIIEEDIEIIKLQTVNKFATNVIRDINTKHRSKDNETDFNLTNEETSDLTLADNSWNANTTEDNSFDICIDDRIFFKIVSRTINVNESDNGRNSNTTDKLQRPNSQKAPIEIIAIDEINNYIFDMINGLENDTALFSTFYVKLDEATLNAVGIDVRVMAKLIIDEIEEGDDFKWT
ncbi:34173_t:CDS:2, partial [Racocetra persica]